MEKDHSLTRTGGAPYAQQGLATQPDKAPMEFSASKSFYRWKVSSPAQGIHSAVRISPSLIEADLDAKPPVRAVTPAPQATNQTAIQLLKKLKSRGGLTDRIDTAIKELEKPDITIKSSEALREVMRKLVSVDFQFSDNVLVFNQLWNLGCHVFVHEIPWCFKLMDISLIEKLCSQSKDPKEFVRENVLKLIRVGTKDCHSLLASYLTEDDIVQEVRNANSTAIIMLFKANGPMEKLPDICPKVIELIWKALQPDYLRRLDNLEQQLSQGIKNPLQETSDYNFEGVFIQTLIWLDHHNYPETITALMAELSLNHRRLLSLISLSLGLGNLSSCLASTVHIPLSNSHGREISFSSPRGDGKDISMVNNDSYLLHQLIHLPPRVVEYLSLKVEVYISLTPLFESFGISSEGLKKMASQRDQQGRLPLQVLFEERLDCSCSDPLFLMDRSRFQSWFDFLLQYTPKDALPDCLAILLSSSEVKNVNYYWALLKFIRAGCDLSKVIKPVVISDSDSDSDSDSSFGGDLPVRDRNDNSETVQALLDYFRRFPETLSHPEKTEQMIHKLKLSPAFQAVTLLAMAPQERRKMFEIWRENPLRMASLFIDRDFSLNQQYTGPWLPFMVVMQHDLPAPVDTAAAEKLENDVQSYQEGMGGQTIPDFPLSLKSLWRDTDQQDMYGRSLLLRWKRKSSLETGGDSSRDYRLKFRKMDIAPEPWADFTREQAVLSSLQSPHSSVSLESQLLKPGGIYRVPDAREFLSRGDTVPEQFQVSLEQCVHFNPDNSAYVQVFEGASGTEHYHHYPYLIDPGSGLTRESAFEGTRLYCRDSGKLWRMGIKSPDALNVYHNSVGSKPWNPLPGYALRRQTLFCTSSLCAWNSQIPDIAHAPVGMRDFQGVIAMKKLPNDIYGERRLNWSDPLDMRRGRLIELAKQFYGVTLNWLRVRHDQNELNHQNPEHLTTLGNEMVTLYADLFSSAFGGDVDTWKDSLVNILPAETLRQAARECLYWCSPQRPYVKDIRNKRFPSEVYPEHSHSDLELKETDLYEDGFKSHPTASGSNLGHVNCDNIVLHHLAAIFWFSVMEGVLIIKPNNNRSVANAPVS